MRWTRSQPPHRPLVAAPSLLILLLLGAAWPSEAISFRTVQCSSGTPGLLIAATRAELLSAYTLVFAMSDGSTAELSDDPLLQEQQVRNILNVLHMSSGLYVCGGLDHDGDGEGCSEEASGTNGTSNGNKTAQPIAPQQGTERLLACGDSALRMSMLAAMGNFVSPLPSERGQQQQAFGGEQLLPRVVVDVYSGKLAVASPYGAGGGTGDSARLYFLVGLNPASLHPDQALALTPSLPSPCPAGGPAGRIHTGHHQAGHHPERDYHHRQGVPRWRGSGPEDLGVFYAAPPLH